VTTILAFAVVISILVLVHELGHHLAAKWFGVPVEVFSVGFGPRLLAIRYARTEYRVSLIPLGGYVKMSGTSLAGQDATPDGFDSKRPWQRFVILLAGPVMNIGFALVLAIAALLWGIELPAYRIGPPLVGAVVEGSAAQRAGLKPGDRIVDVSGRALSSWAGLDSQIAAQGEQPLSLTVRRGDAEITAILPASKNAVSAGILPDAHPVLRRVARNSSADHAGLRTGDVVLAINSVPTNVTTDVAGSLARLSDRPVLLAVGRNGQELAMSLPARETFGAVAAIPTVLYGPEPLDAVVLGTRAIAGSSLTILQTLGGLITGETSARTLVGPVGLAQSAGESWQLGWRALLAAMAFISLNLGLCNLLPIPILDGGHMLMLLAEGVIRRDVPFQMRKALVGAGAMAMLLLLVTTFYNDLGRLGWL
jgi:regulator of sigma E protease